MTTYIDIAISLVLIFLIFSVVVYVLQELIAVNLQYRAKMLWRALAQVLDNAKFKTARSLGKKGLVEGTATPFTDLLFNHPQVKALQRDDKTQTSYIPAENVALAVIDLISKNAHQAQAQQQPQPQPGVNNLLADFRAGLDILAALYSKPPQFLSTASWSAQQAPPAFIPILQSISNVSPTLEDLRHNIEKWYNEYMNRVSGWYQAHTVLTVRILAVLVTLFFNLNCIQLVKDIAANSNLQASLVGIAQQVSDHPAPINLLYTQQFSTTADSITRKYQDSIDKSTNPKQQAQLKADRDKMIQDAASGFTKQSISSIRQLTDTLSAVHLPIGWTGGSGKNFLNALGNLFNENATGAWPYFLLALLGWFIMAGCISMGAPFWFNLLIQLVNIRRAGVKPASSTKKK